LLFCCSYSSIDFFIFFYPKTIYLDEITDGL
jgi:hypothetical protein